MVSIVRRYLTNKPDLETARDLLALVKTLARKDQATFMGDLGRWYSRPEEILKERTTSRTLRTWLEENGIPYQTDKEVRDGHVIRLYEEDPSRSSRDIETLCKEQGIEISYRTIQRIVKRYNDQNE